MTPYEYGAGYSTNAFNIGWLEKGKAYRKGKIPAGFLERLRRIKLTNQCRGLPSAPKDGKVEA